MFRARAAAPGIHTVCIQRIAVLAIILQVLFPAGYMAGDLDALPARQILIDGIS